MPFLTQGKTNWKFLGIVAVLAIIVGGGILFLSTPRYRPALGAQTRSELSSLRAGIAICCAVPINQLQATAGSSDICDPAVGVILPTHHDLGLARFSHAADISYAVIAQCDTDIPTITVTIKNHRKEACNGIWTITESQLIIPSGC